MIDRIRICKRCLMVEGVDWYQPSHCWGAIDHSWVLAKATLCPFLSKPTRGRWAPQARADADALCEQAPAKTHGPHHYGDPQRRHFIVARGGNDG